MPAMYRYRTHGLTLESEIELPELMCAAEAPHATSDVTIRYGRVPEPASGSIPITPGYRVSDGSYLLDMRGIARYRARDGCEVTIAPAPDAAEGDVRAFVLGSVMAAILHQRGLLPLHASAVEVDGQSLLFVGPSGTGKSTLAAAFHGRGHRVIADDVSVVSFSDEGSPFVELGYRHVKLWRDSLDRVGSTLGPRRKVGEAMRKYSALVPQDPLTAPVPLGWIVVLGKERTETITLRALHGRHKIMAVVGGLYRRRMSAHYRQAGPQFEQCAAIGHRVHTMAIDHPRDLAHIDRLVDRIQDAIHA